MGPGRIELPTSRLSGVRSRQLSYEPFQLPIEKTNRKSAIANNIKVG